MGCGECTTWVGPQKKGAYPENLAPVSTATRLAVVVRTVLDRGASGGHPHPSHGPVLAIAQQPMAQPITSPVKGPVALSVMLPHMGMWGVPPALRSALQNRRKHATLPAPAHIAPARSASQGPWAWTAGYMRAGAVAAWQGASLPARLRAAACVSMGPPMPGRLPASQGQPRPAKAQGEPLQGLPSRLAHGRAGEQAGAAQRACHHCHPGQLQRKVLLYRNWVCQGYHQERHHHGGKRGGRQQRKLPQGVKGWGGLRAEA